MRHLFIIIATAFLLLAVNNASAQNNTVGLPDEAFETLKRAVALGNEGMYEAALTDFDNLAERFPDNYVVQYERLFALYHLQRFDDVAKEAKKLVKHKDADPMVFQMYGNVLDILGKPDEARKVYHKGLERFPTAGFLYLELGNLDFMSGKYADALDNYNEGIDVQPGFASNYYRGAMICFLSERAKVWALVYAETAILLAPNKEDRKSEMSEKIRNCLRDNIRIEVSGDSAKASVTLVPDRKMILNRDGDIVYLDFPGIYEGCTVGAVTDFVAHKKPFSATIAQLIELRRGIVEAYFACTDNLYGNSMYLLPFSKSVIDAGHWEAYNYFIFDSCVPDEYNAWIKENEEKMMAFVDWYNQQPFTLDATHTVGVGQIYSDYRPLNLVESLAVQSDLITYGKGEVPSEDSDE